MKEYYHSVDASSLPFANEEMLELMENENYNPRSLPIDTVVEEIAVRPFNAWDRKLFYGDFLAAAKNKTITQNNIQRMKDFAISLTAFRSRLEKYVDIKAVEDEFKKQNPGFTLTSKSGAPDEIITEAVHQFQMKCFVTASEYDGIIGHSTLHSLGFIFYDNRRKFDPKPSVKRIIEGMDETIKKYAQAASMPANLQKATGKNWFREYLINPEIFGFRGKDFGYHCFFILKLREAENLLLDLYQNQLCTTYIGELKRLNPGAIDQSKIAATSRPCNTPRYLGKMLDITENHADVRGDDGKDNRGFHYNAIAIDINYERSPWVRDDKGLARLKEAAAYGIKVSTLPITTYQLAYDKLNAYSDAQHYFQYLGENYNTTQLYEILYPLSSAFIDLKNSQGKSNDTVNWGGSTRQPNGGFLNHDKNLVITLRDRVSLAWGAVDFGPGALGNGDMMHFDMRTTDLGIEYASKIDNDILPWLKKTHPKYKPTATTRELEVQMEGESWFDAITDKIKEFGFWTGNGIQLMSRLNSLFKGGEKDAEKLTNKLFLEVLHPGSAAKLAVKGSTEARHWNALYNFVVGPFLVLNGRAVKTLQGNVLIPKSGTTPTLLVKNKYSLVQFPLSGPGFARYTNNDDDVYKHPDTGVLGKHGDNWIDPQTAADFFNAIQDFNATADGNGVTIHYGDVSALDPSINLGHKTHNHGKAIDIHYIGSAGEEIIDADAYKNGDVTKMNTFFNIVQQNGFTENFSFGKRFTHAGNNNQPVHKNHFHVAKPAGSGAGAVSKETEYESSNEADTSSTHMQNRENESDDREMAEETSDNYSRHESPYSFPGREQEDEIDNEDKFKQPTILEPEEESPIPWNQLRPEGGFEYDTKPKSKKKIKLTSDDPPLYFVGVDITDALDTIVWGHVWNETFGWNNLLWRLDKDPKDSQRRIDKAHPKLPIARLKVTHGGKDYADTCIMPHGINAKGTDKHWSGADAATNITDINAGCDFMQTFLLNPGVDKSTSMLNDSGTGDVASVVYISSHGLSNGEMFGEVYAADPIFALTKLTTQGAQFGGVGWLLLSNCSTVKPYTHDDWVKAMTGPNPLRGLIGFQDVCPLADGSASIFKGFIRRLAEGKTFIKAWAETLKAFKMEDAWVALCHENAVDDDITDFNGSSLKKIPTTSKILLFNKDNASGTAIVPKSDPFELFWSKGGTRITVANRLTSANKLSVGDKVSITIRPPASAKTFADKSKINLTLVYVRTNYPLAIDVNKIFKVTSQTGIKVPTTADLNPDNPAGPDSWQLVVDGAPSEIILNLECKDLTDFHNNYMFWIRADLGSVQNDFVRNGSITIK